MLNNCNCNFFWNIEQIYIYYITNNVLRRKKMVPHNHSTALPVKIKKTRALCFMLIHVLLTAYQMHNIMAALISLCLPACDYKTWRNTIVWMFMFTPYKLSLHFINLEPLKVLYLNILSVSASTTGNLFRITSHWPSCSCMPVLFTVHLTFWRRCTQWSGQWIFNER